MAAVHRERVEQSSKDWCTNHLDFSERYMCNTKEYPRHDMCITIEQRPGGDDEDQATVWDCARTCSAWFASDAFPDDFWHGKRVLELGAGTGLCGLVVAKLGATVTITELPELLPVLEKNVELNQLGDKCSVRSLPWGDHGTPEVQEWFASEAPYDVVIAVEVAYAVGVQDLLVKTLAAASGPQTLVYVGHEHRWRDVDEWFVQEIDTAFTCKVIPREQHPPQYRSDRLSIYSLTLKTAGAVHTEQGGGGGGEEEDEAEEEKDLRLGSRDPFNCPVLLRKLEALEEAADSRLRTSKAF